MGGRIRFWEPDVVYEISVRTVDRTFSFVPNHRDDHALIADTCGTQALCLTSDVIPDPSIINIIGAAVGRTLKNYPVNVHSFESNIDHLHFKLSAPLAQLNNLAPFMKGTLSLIARGVNRVWQREGHLFGGRTRIHACVDDESAENKLLYAITNTVKDNMAETALSTPFFSTYKHQSSGSPLRYWYIDYKAYWTAGGRQNKKHRLKDYLCWTQWNTTPLPSQQNKTVSQRQTWIRKQVREIENAIRKERKANGRKVIGKNRLRETDPRERPKNPKKSGPAPLCHAATETAAKEYKEKWRNYKDAFIQASADYRNGLWDREFPEGSYRPPLLNIAVRGDP